MYSEKIGLYMKSKQLLLIEQGRTKVKIPDGAQIQLW